MYTTDTRKAARQIVKASLDQILAGTYHIPSLEDMTSILEESFDHPFDDYKAKRGISRMHWGWSDTQISDELDRQRRHYENELRVNLKVAALNTIEVIENLIKSLNKTIKAWKISHLE